MNTITLNLKEPAVVESLERHEQSSNSGIAVIKAVFTRQIGGDWKLLMAQCMIRAATDEIEAEYIYRTIAFVTKHQPAFTISSFFCALGNEGLPLSDNLPNLKNMVNSTTWQEEIVPGHATDTGYPARRFTAKIVENTHFHDGQLFGVDKPYRKSARHYIAEFLNLEYFNGHSDARKGELCIQITDRRGAIQVAYERVSFSGLSDDLALVGQLNDDTPICLKTSNDCHRFESVAATDVQLWLLNGSDELIDFRSSTEWPYKFRLYEDNREDRQALLELIDGGESEACEFKTFIRLRNKTNKVTDFEKTVCAFSNSVGGRVFVGIDDEGEIVGLESAVSTEYGAKEEDAIASYEADVKKRLRETLKDTHCFKTQVLKLRACLVLVITVEPASGANYLPRSNEAYIRKGATSMRMSPPEIQARTQRDGDDRL